VRERERNRMSTVCRSVSQCRWCCRAIYITRALKIWLMKYITPSPFCSWSHSSLALTTISSKQTPPWLTRSLFSLPTYIWTTMDFGLLWDYGDTNAAETVWCGKYTVTKVSHSSWSFINIRLLLNLILFQL